MFMFMYVSRWVWCGWRLVIVCLYFEGRGVGGGSDHVFILCRGAWYMRRC